MEIGTRSILRSSIHCLVFAAHFLIPKEGNISVFLLFLLMGFIIIFPHEFPFLPGAVAAEVMGIDIGMTIVLWNGGGCLVNGCRRIARRPPWRLDSPWGNGSALLTKLHVYLPLYTVILLASLY
jgi:hypothetical protein